MSKSTVDDGSIFTYPVQLFDSTKQLNSQSNIKLKVNFARKFKLEVLIRR